MCVSCNTITASKWKTMDVLGFICWRSCRLKIFQSLKVKDHVFTKYLHMKAFSAKRKRKFELRCFALFIDCSEEDSVFKWYFSGSWNSRQILTFLLLFLTVRALQVPTSAFEVLRFDRFYILQNLSNNFWKSNMELFFGYIFSKACKWHI